MERFLRNKKKTTLIDLSSQLHNQTSSFEINPHHITYSLHKDAVTLSQKLLDIDESYWPNGEGWAIEEVTLSTHAGTHIDAPYHYGPTTNGSPAKTIDQVPLRWCFGNGVVLDMTHKSAGEGIDDEDIKKELDRIQYHLQPFDIVLIHTGASKYFSQPKYDLKHAGLVRSATEYLVDQGIRLIGIDAWGLDRPFDIMAKEAKEGKTQFWESHLLGREKEYLQIEKLCNLDQLPEPFGFTICAFPVNIAGASAGWSRVVAIIEEA
ncbi:cyclase family protein [Shimazuella kribbensis]|uniref:cyclase family protein n=1 Tax=Shimazuella kribbensis TaxID=139808 RepID=UPI000410CC08|nr:cyclase family protein [Shimazuella kribbensis]